MKSSQAFTLSKGVGPVHGHNISTLNDIEHQCGMKIVMQSISLFQSPSLIPPPKASEGMVSIIGDKEFFSCDSKKGLWGQ